MAKKERLVNQSWWITTLLVNQHKRCPPLTSDIKADVCIVGGGFAGVAAAVEFLKSGHKVVLIEKNILGGSSSGRSAGFLTPDSELVVTARAASQAPTKLGLKPGSKIKVSDAAKALVTQSANDAAVTIAENLRGSEENFARLMTETGRRIGMTNTTFRNASGLPNDEQMSTARDMAILSAHLIVFDAGRGFPGTVELFDDPSTGVAINNPAQVVEGIGIRVGQQQPLQGGGASGSGPHLVDEHRAQLHNYLKATGKRLGMLVNFGHYPKLEHERIAR